MAHRIITLCGSMRFFENMLKVAAIQTSAGHIVLAPFESVAVEDQSGELKAMLDALHLDKIAMSDLVIVVSDDTGYYGDSTRREIAYARRRGVEVLFTPASAFTLSN